MNTIEIRIWAVAALMASAACMAFGSPELDFDAAVKAGKPLSAEAAYKEWTKAGGARMPSIRHVQAAEVAEQIGKSTLRNDRLMLYVRLEKNWNPTVERILWRFVASGTDVDLFARLAANTKATNALWIEGRGMMRRLSDQKRSTELIRLADILLSTFADEQHSSYVLQKLYDDGSYAGEGYPLAQLAELIMKHPGLGGYGALNTLMGWGNQRKAFPVNFAFRYWAKHGGELHREILERAMRDVKRDDAKKLKPEEIADRDEAIKVLRQMEEKLLFNGKHNGEAITYYWLAGVDLPTLFDPSWKHDDKAPVTAPSALRIARKIMALKEFGQSVGYRGAFWNTHVQVAARKRFSEADAKAIKEAFDKYPSQTKEQEDLIKKIRDEKDKVKCEPLVRQLIAKADKSFNSWDFLRWATLERIGKGELVNAYRMKRAEMTGDINELTYCVPDKGAEKPVAGIDMKKMSAWQAHEYFQRVFNNLKDDKARQAFMIDFLTAHSVVEIAENHMDSRMQWCNRMASYDSAFLKQLPIDALLKDAFGKPVQPRGWDLGTRIWVARLGVMAGRTNDVLNAAISWAKTIDPIERISAIATLRRSNLIIWRKNKNGKMEDSWRGMFDGAAGDRLFNELYEAIKNVPETQYGRIDFHTELNVGDTLRWKRNWAYEQESKDKPFTDARKKRMLEVRKELDTWYDLITSRILGMARHSEGWKNQGVAWNRPLRQAIDAKDMAGLSRYARRAAVSADWWSVGYDTIMKTMDDLKACENNEVLYIYVDSLPGDLHGDILTKATKMRAEVASKLPGIYPVGENDPAYPLYLAADALARNNPERAWQILSQARNQTVFEREALKLPPAFVVWGVEQLRMARGTKDALIVKARQIATAIIAQESKVTPEMIAAMMLSRAEGYRDQQNFEAAKLEYQSVRDNPTYHATKYGKKAMFRAIDLQIASGNAQGVDATLEYWLSQNDREVQAQAHYFLARLAFDRKDYDECIKQLRQVFAIDYTHTEGRFLQGEWKLATNSEVDDTDVLVGNLAERSMIKPGSPLTVTVQDKNLSVAGGGASIPVIVTTEPGGDRALMNLYPTSRDPSNFKGLLPVQLGKANPSNLVLEVRGDDTVSYVIDPKFLKERGLPLNEPKRLRVIDDAKVAIGAGAPRTEEKKAEAGVKNLLSGEGGSEALAQKLRPGNPLYIVVKDADTSLGGTDDSVKVTIETTSGDRIEGCELKEEKPFTGIFRAKVDTTLPPPRAFASDTAAGMNPGDVINAKKTTGWKSLADSQPGKWFAVDTMGSHLMSEITLDTPNAADIKSIKLVGRMGSRVMTLGQLPEATEKSKLYLRRQQQNDDRPMRSISQLRAFCETGRAAKPYLVEKLEFRSLHKNPNHFQWQSALFRGPMCVPNGVDALRCHIVPVSKEKEALRDLWVGLAIDGEEVFSGQGMKLQNALVSCDITPGCHQFELAVVGARMRDAFDFKWEQADGTLADLPQDWFNEEKNPALKTFVKDRATILRTETGFRASFTKSERLRSIRWEFADVKSPAIAVTRLTAKNDKGETILPVESDYSDALNNNTLEVAPGDRITVKYEDERTTSGQKKVLQRQIASSFNDGKVRFIFEDVDQYDHVTAYDAFRFQPGDALVLCVTDPDCDTTDEADSVTVSIKNAEGKTFTKKLVESRPRWMGGSEEDTYGMHTGYFMGVLRTCPEADTNAPPKVLRTRTDDQLSVSYDDRENTDPGVPCTRTVRIFAARSATPQITLFDVKKTQEVDNSADAKILLDRIRRRPGNENVKVVYRDVLTAAPMARDAIDTTKAIPFNVAAGAIPVRVNDRSRARYACSKVLLEAVAESEIAKAEAEGREADKVTIPLKLGASFGDIHLVKGGESMKESCNAGTFNGLVKLSLGPIDPNIEVPDDAPPVLCVTGSDRVHLTVLSEDGQSVLTRTVKLVSNASMGLTDSSFEAERNAAHVGECFFVKVDDADRDQTEDPDRIEGVVLSEKTGVKRPITLTETMPHSGIFTGRLRPVMFAPGETIPSVSTGGVASANEILTEERFAVGYGDRVIFRYHDEITLPGTPTRDLTATGTVFRGSSGNVRLFSKRFTDRDTAVLVQFRLAECLFEQAKEHRKLKQADKSAAAIAEGKFILEEALKNYPDSSHVVQGEYLLANLYQELATEAKDAGDMAKATPLYQEALSRFSQILGTWPEGEFAARSQYHKALCLEMLKDYARASEEYVKMTYIYPESELVGDATIRLATYYYTQEKRFDISGHIYANFQKRFPQHDKAPRALFMAGSCFIKQAETIAADIEKRLANKERLPEGARQKIDLCYRDAIKTFDSLVETYRDSAPKLRAQALYWAGDVAVRVHDSTKAYQYLKRCVFEFPETEWARRARGLLLQEADSFKDFE